MRLCIRAVMVTVLALCSIGTAPWTAVAQGNVNGTVYTSPTFGYQLQWSEPWFFVEEVPEAGADTIILSDGTSQAVFSFNFIPSASAPEILDVVLGTLDTGVTNVQPVLDAQGVPLGGGDETRAWSVISATQQLPDGTSVDFVQYFDIRTLSGGVVLLMSASAASYYYDESFLQTWKDLADTALVTEAPGPPIATEVPTTTLAPTVPAAPTAPAQPTIPASPAGAGESAPAFAAGPWRIAARAVDRGETIDYLGLGFVDGSQWVVVYADVTNWSAADATLDVATVTLATAAGPISPELTGTQSAAAALGLEPADGSSVTIPAGSGARLALVYSVPLSESEFILELDGMQLPLADAVGRQLDVTDLSTIEAPPQLVSGTLRSVPDDGSGQPGFLVDTGNGEVPIHLAGIDFTEQAGCTPIVGDTVDFSLEFGSGPVWLETDPAITEPDTYYVWLEDDQGWSLLNERLIANGLAFEGDLPEAARFGAWLEQAESIARSSKTGIWQLCA
ncbi:MAG TPA: hypothetical protein VFP05_06690 [Thermomicrobiales bacterium]|nr:hypothetical protein [Thermomicrobiales bacterium]